MASSLPLLEVIRLWMDYLSSAWIHRLSGLRPYYDQKIGVSATEIIQPDYRR